uniref:ribose-phosphate diphosphokinase n=1 Tax=Compsopogon caeruleus TaxID=31354 RepID=A0A7S1XDR2_9RHOD|mmetsp:Transcript_332/g.573  ORF Transcript_332/g.573 Transcript_332/m.573 type:complete len:385 (+) Transcript_332:132-1286(+)
MNRGISFVGSLYGARYGEGLCLRCCSRASRIRGPVGGVRMMSGSGADVVEEVRRAVREDYVTRTGMMEFGSRRLRVLAGTSSMELAREIARYLGQDGPEAVVSRRFSDGESYVKIERSVRGCDVFIVQSTGPPVNDNLMEMLLLIDACRRAHAAQVTVVVPYYGYARADRIVEKREALSSKLVANLITKAGADRVVVMDIHSAQSCGFFDIPLDHVYGSQPLVRHLRALHGEDLHDLVIVSPDVGGVARARAVAKMLDDAPLAIIDKRRSAHNVAEVMNLIGEVEGKTAILVDDMIDTAGTICAGSKLLRKRGAKSVYAMATHALFSGPAIERLSEPGIFERVIVTNSLDIPLERQFPQLEVVSAGEALGEAIWRVHDDFSVVF